MRLALLALLAGCWTASAHETSTPKASPPKEIHVYERRPCVDDHQPAEAPICTDLDPDECEAAWATYGRSVYPWIGWTIYACRRT